MLNIALSTVTWVLLQHVEVIVHTVAKLYFLLGGGIYHIIRAI